MHKSQALLIFLVAFISGVAIASLVDVHFFIIIILLFTSIVVIAIAGYQKTFSKKGLIYGAALLFLTIGIIRFNQFNFSHSVLSSFADIRVGQDLVPVTVRGYLVSEQKTSGASSRFDFKVKELEVVDRIFVLNEKTQIITASHPKYNIGEALEITGSVKFPENSDESDFNYVAYLKHQSIQTEIFYPQIDQIDGLDIGFAESLKLRILKGIYVVKNKFQESINKSVSEPNASCINGILLGSRQNIPDDLKEAFNRTSTTHILAISGYNITILAEAILAMLVYFVRRRKAFWISVAIIVAFTIMTGASASVVRAAIMGLILLFAQSFGRLNDVKNAILLAAAAMIYFNPFVLRFDIGFQLSFLALVGLIYVYPLFKQRFRRLASFGNLKETFFQSLSAQIMVAPLLLYYFNSFSVVSLPVNALILPFMPYIMLLGFLTGIAGIIFSPLGQLVGFVAWALSQYQIKIIQFFAQFEFSSLSFRIPILVLVTLYLVILYFLYKYTRKLILEEIKI